MSKFITRGEMFFRRAKQFRNGFGAERGDSCELLTSSHSPKTTTIKVNDVVVEGVVGPILVDDGHDNPLIYSMYSISNNHFKQRENLIDLRCKEFGEYAVIIKDLERFYRRLEKQHREQKVDIEAAPIEYVDKQTYSGSLGRFRKFADNHDHQEEWRIVLDKVNPELRTYKLYLGSLSEFAVLCKFDEIEEIITIKK